MQKQGLRSENSICPDFLAHLHSLIRIFVACVEFLFIDAPNLVGHFVSSRRERLKRNRSSCRGAELDKWRRMRNILNEITETEEMLTCLPPITCCKYRRPLITTTSPPTSLLNVDIFSTTGNILLKLLTWEVSNLYVRKLNCNRFWMVSLVQVKFLSYKPKSKIAIIL